MKFILTADWHIRKDRPRCRLDEDWMKTQSEMIQFIIDIANEKEVPLYIVGDIFDDSWEPNEVVTMIIDKLKLLDYGVRILAGQHELPYHKYNYENRSVYGILRRRFKEIRNSKDGLIGAAHFGQKIKNKNAKILFIHELIVRSKRSRIAGRIGLPAEELLKRYPKAKWIFTGDNHHHFHYREDGRHVVNPGCILRQDADFINYQPIIYYIDTKRSIVDKIELPDHGNVVTDQYIKEEEQRSARIDAFIASIKKKGKVTLNFIDNLRNKADSLDPVKNVGVKDIITELIEEIIKC